MPQSAFLAYAIGFGFLVFVTLKGELPQYIAVFIGKTDGGGSAPGVPGVLTTANRMLPVGGVNGTGVGTVEPGTQSLPGFTAAPSPMGSGEPMMSP